MTDLNTKPEGTNRSIDLTILDQGRWRPAARFSLVMLLLASAATPGLAQEVNCPPPAEDRAESSSGGSSAASRLNHPDRVVRDMARADIAYDENRRDEATSIYRRLAETPADRRQTARRANLKLAQAALSAGDFNQAEAYLAKASGSGALPDLRARAVSVRTAIANRRELAADEAALDAIDPLVAGNRFDEALQATNALLSRSCPNPPDYAARVKVRLAQVYRAKGDLTTARNTAVIAQSSATTPRVRERATVLIGQIEQAVVEAQLAASVDQANALLQAGNAPAAIAILMPLANRADLAPELQRSVRLRLARAYVQTRRFDEAAALVQPMLAADGGAASLSPEDYETVARIYLAQANDRQARRDLPGASQVYRQIVGWTPPVSAEIRDSARLGLARVLAQQGDRAGALEQIALVRESASSPRLLERANSLLAGLQDDAPLDRLYGYVESGLAYDTNVPTLVSAVRDDQDDDVDFPTDRRFDDAQANISGRLQYRHQLGSSGNYVELLAAGLRTFQFDLPKLDRTRLEFRAGPVFALPGGTTDILAGGEFTIEWRGGKFRYSEPGVYVGVRHDLGDRLTATAIYTLARHNDYRDEQDGTDHSLETAFRYDLNDADRLTARLRAKRQGARVKDSRNTGLLAGLGYRHRWQSDGRIVPFVDASGEVERIRFDGLTELQKRRDWKVRLQTGVGAEIDSRWRARLGYAFYDISSNVDSRDRLADHQINFAIRYSWN